MLGIALIGIVVVILLFAIFRADSDSKDDDRLIQKNTTVSDNSSADDLPVAALGKQFRDPKASDFAFDYPDSWHLYTESGGDPLTGVLISAKDQEPWGHEGIGFRIGFSVSEDANVQTELAGSDVVTSEVVIDGRSAKRTRIQTTSSENTNAFVDVLYSFLENGKTYLISIESPVNDYDELLEKEIIASVTLN